MLAYLESYLRTPGTYLDGVRHGDGLSGRIATASAFTVAALAGYGFTMGFYHSPAQAVSAAAKLPVVFLLSLLVSLAALQGLSAALGSRLGLAQTLGLLTYALAVTGGLLLSLAPVMLFFALATDRSVEQYQFVKLAHVAAFTAAAGTGAGLLYRGLGAVQEGILAPAARRRVFWIWLLVYAFVGSQLAWTLRPWVATPDLPLEFIRAAKENFYVDIVRSVRELAVGR